ncbi:MAG: nucleotide sugar dehydrogenase [bacterium]|nr:nucleotide sugar dehydrogenase [bacterium]
MTSKGETARTTVCVQGLGFVGAAMALAVAEARDTEGQPCFDVVGVDLPTPLGRERIAALERGDFPFQTSDPALQQAARRAAKTGNLHATHDPSAFASADVIVVDVHLDVTAERNAPARANLDAFSKAIETIGTQIKPGALVIVETTVPPGTTERIVAPLLAEAFRRRQLPEDGFLLAHSYERVMPGDEYLASITNFWRVYAGFTDAASEACKQFLSRVINTEAYPLRRLGSPTASEIAKVLENSYRATNIAFIEEWGRLAEAVGVDLFEVIDAIRLRPTHSNIRQPGFGVGGYCLTKDPLFARLAAREIFDRPDLQFPFSELAVRTNRQMPMVALERLSDLLGATLAGKRIALLGIAYRQEVGDTRYSPSQLFVEAARERGAEVVARDPMVHHWEELGLDIPEGLPPASELDAVVFAVPHRTYRELDVAAWLAGATPVVLDANAVLSDRQCRAIVSAGCVLAAIGRG